MFLLCKIVLESIYIENALQGQPLGYQVYDFAIVPEVHYLALRPST